MWRQIGNHGYMAWDLDNLAHVALERGDYLAAQAYLNECWAIFEELGNRSGLAWTLYKLAIAEGDQRRCEPARDLLQKSLAIFEELGDRNGRAWCIEELSLVARGSGDLTTARSYIDQAMELFREIEDHQDLAYAMQRRGVSVAWKATWMRPYLAIKRHSKRSWPPERGGASCGFFRKGRCWPSRKSITKRPSSHGSRRCHSRRARSSPIAPRDGSFSISPSQGTGSFRRSHV